MKAEKVRGGAAELVELLQNPDRDEMAIALMLESVKKTDAAAVVAGLETGRLAGIFSSCCLLLSSF